MILTSGRRSTSSNSASIQHANTPLLRWVLTQAAWQLVMRSPKWRRIYENLKQRSGPKKAITAVTRRLLSLCFTLLKRQEPYREITPEPTSRVKREPAGNVAGSRT